MKAVRIALLVLGLLAAPAWAGPGANVYDVGVDGLGCPFCAYGIDGLGCPFCAYGIEKQLGSVAGVDTVDVDIKRGVVIVTMAAGATLDEGTARQAVENAGFDLRSFAPVSGE